MAATGKGKLITDRFDTFVDPDRNRSLLEAGNELLNFCKEHLEAKVCRIKFKASSLPNGEIGDAMRHRWDWELVFVKSKINEADHISRTRLAYGEQLAIDALEFATQCGVHPAWLQTPYLRIIDLLNTRLDRLGSAKERVKDFINGLQK